jgi:hypothetical protein
MNLSNKIFIFEKIYAVFGNSFVCQATIIKSRDPFISKNKPTRRIALSQHARARENIEIVERL